VAHRRPADPSGEVVTQSYPEGELWVATFRDPSGNVIGVWQRGPRRLTDASEAAIESRF
jgi:predicted enzyme related to lactoylglutathione lyase